MAILKRQDPMLDRFTSGRTDLVLDLVAAGQPATFRDAGGESLISTCAYFGDVSAIRFLVSRGERLKSLGQNLGLNSAAFHGHWQLCEFLLENGADANGADPNTGETALHAALCTANRPGCGLAVKVLVAAGVDPNRTTKPGAETGGFMRDCRTKGETALHRAAAFASEETIQLLLDAGATVDARDVNGDTSLGWASWHNRADTVLRKLCYGRFHVRDGRKSMEASLLGEPRKS
ncbi:MAG: ankyrin repeat domain-containing protein [Gemmatimonadaceae bacterium]